MKTYLLFIIIGSCLLFASCSENEDFSYSGNTQIYLGVGGDSMQYSFAIKPSFQKEDTIRIPVRITGLTTDYDRPIDLRIIPELTTAREGSREEGGHFYFSPAILPKNEISSDILLVVNRQEDLEKGNVSIAFKILPNQFFGGGMGEKTLTYRVVLNDILTLPTNWDRFIKSYFGNKSLVKYQFIIDVLGIATFPGSGDDAISPGQMYFYKDKLKTELVKYEKENGPLIDENNNRVTFN